MYVREDTMIRLLIVIAFVFTTGCAKLDFDGFDPTTATLRWIIKSSNVKRTSVHVTPRASLCTATDDLRNKKRVGVEPLPSCKYVHRKHGG